jgi:quercetin dioxygenase-like cupin family protein
MSTRTVKNEDRTPTGDGGPEPERIWFLSSLATIHLPAEETGGRFSMVEMVHPAGDQPPLHVHRTDDEGFYVIEGRLKLWFGDQVRELGPGEFAQAPHGVPHTYRVESPEAVRVLVTSSDASFDRFVRAYGEPASEPRLPEPSEPDPERLGMLAWKHGIEILGPPGALPA